MPTTNSLERIRTGLKNGHLWDGAFDWLLPTVAREKASQYWCPLAVARRAAQRFAESGARRVLDVGAGPGKFCIAASMARPDVEFSGVEHRMPLVQVARALAAGLGLWNLDFRAGDAFAVPWCDFDGLFFFNPFFENVFSSDEIFDTTVELSEARFASELQRTAELLSSLRTGSVAITYCGLGGPIPSSYDLMHEEPMGTGCLRTWVKRRSYDAGWFHVDEQDEVSQMSRRCVRRSLERMTSPAGSVV